METMFVSFSGGRTSAFMCHWLINNMSHKHKFIFTFANTGLEHEKTLEFVDKCDKAFGLNLVWVEAVINPERGKGTTHKVVDFDSACRDGRLFEEMIDVYGIPNNDYPHCNRELKLQAMKSYKSSLGFSKNHLMAIGIRSDEADRMSVDAEKFGLTYPLIKWAPTTKAQIIHWWADQDFDLEIPEHYGNCVTCWKKSDRKLMTIARHEPERFDFFNRMEKTKGHCGAGNQERVFFRGYKTAQKILDDSKIPFVEFVDHKPELQLSFIDEIDPIDIESDCGAGCEYGGN